MIVAIDRPCFLPSLEHLDRARAAELVLLLDDAPFDGGDGERRARIKTGLRTQWLTVPVCEETGEAPIRDVLIDNRAPARRDWGRAMFRTLEAAYRDAPHFADYAPELKRILEARWEWLVDLDRALMDLLLDACDVRRPVVRSSALGVPVGRPHRLVELCRLVGADAFLGDGGRGRADEETLRRAGLRPVRRAFRHPRYVQHPHPASFVEGLSAADLLFNCGPESAARLRGAAQEEAYASRAG